MFSSLKKIVVTLTILVGAFGPLTTFAQTSVGDSDTGGGAAIDSLRQTSSQTVSASEIQLQARENARDAGLQQSLGNGRVTDPGVAAAAPSGTFTAPGSATNALSSAAPSKDFNLADADFCSIQFFGPKFQPLNCIGYFLLKLGGWVATVGGVFLNLAIDFTVLKMSSVINSTGAINAAWKVFRDLANIFFIFILIYIAISTIIGTAGGQTKKMLINVIIVALLINFSMFFTKVAVDASNILTVQFFNSISKGDEKYDNGLSWVFMNASRLTTIYQVGNTVSSNATNGTAFLSYNFLIVGIMGLIFALILSFVFIAIAIMFISRFVVIIFLIILSPLAFMGFAVSKLHGKWSDWLSSLIDQLFFAPTMMAMLWTVAVIVNSDGFRSAVAFSDPANNFSDLFTVASVQGSIYVVLNFVLLIALLIGGLLISKNFSRTGSKFAMAFAGGASLGVAAWAGRKTIGKGFNNFAKSPRLQNFAAKNPIIGTYALKAVKGVASSSFDLRGAPQMSGYLGDAGGKGGYKADIERETKDREAVAAMLKDVKVYKDTNTKKDAEHKSGLVEEKDKEIVGINKGMAKLREGGLVTDADKAAFKDLEKKKAEAIAMRDKAKKELETINKDQTKTSTGEQAYGQNLIPTSILGKVVAAVKNPGGGAARAAAAQNLEEKYAKDRQKQEAEWAKKYNLDGVNVEIKDLEGKLEALKNTLPLASEEIENWTREIEVSRKELADFEQKQKNDPNFDIITYNKTQKPALTANIARLESQIAAAKTDATAIKAIKTKEITDKLEAARNAKKEIEGKNNRDAILKTLADAAKEENKAAEPAKESGEPKKDDGH